MNYASDKHFLRLIFVYSKVFSTGLLSAFLCNFTLICAATAAELDAQLDWSRRVELALPVNGVVAGVRVAHGDRVSKGDVLVYLDSREFDTAVNRAQATLKSQQEFQLEATREVERAEELYERTVLSDHELQMTRIALETATAKLETARAALSKARLQKERSELRAPFDAVVVTRDVEVGETIVSTMQPKTVVVLAEADRMLARGKVPVARLAALKIGDDAVITAGKRRFKGSLLRIGLEPIGSESGKPLYEVVYQFVTDGVTLRKGQPVRLELP